MDRIRRSQRCTTRRVSVTVTGEAYISEQFHRVCVVRPPPNHVQRLSVQAGLHRRRRWAAGQENFAVYKPQVAKKRNSVFMKRVLNLKRGARNLNLRDVNEISKVAWEEAFKQENNVKGWATCGLYPFTRRPMYVSNRCSPNTN